jgi:hypothetical protein
MSNLISVERFLKIQARAYNMRGITRIAQLREEIRKLTPPVTPRMAISIILKQADMVQIDQLISYLLDING